jgi:hypothetical protein
MRYNRKLRYDITNFHSDYWYNAKFGWININNNDQGVLLSTHACAYTFKRAKEIANKLFHLDPKCKIIIIRRHRYKGEIYSQNFYKSEKNCRPKVK